MTTLHRCDQCRREARDFDDMIGWLGIRARVPDGRPNLFGGLTSTEHVGDFCSWDCVGEYTTARQLLKEAGQ